MHPWFDNFITTSIALNSLGMVLYNYEDHAKCEFINGWCPMSKQGLYNYVLDLFNIAFGVVFTIECVSKIFALGLVDGYKTYFRSGWNILDFTIVISFLLESSNVNKVNMRPFRILRILRPLKAT